MFVYKPFSTWASHWFDPYKPNPCPAKCNRNSSLSSSFFFCSVSTRAGSRRQCSVIVLAAQAREECLTKPSLDFTFLIFVVLIWVFLCASSRQGTHLHTIADAFPFHYLFFLLNHCLELVATLYMGAAGCPVYNRISHEAIKKDELELHLGRTRTGFRHGRPTWGPSWKI